MRPRENRGERGFFYETVLKWGALGKNENGLENGMAY